MSACVYILASRGYGTLYVGVTTDLAKRIWEHREGVIAGFTRRHGVKLLMHVEVFEALEDARLRELRLKDWKRDWKIELLERKNPDWNDLAVSLLGFEPLPVKPIALRRPGESRDPRRRHFE